MTCHEMKIWPKPFADVASGAKRAEFRDMRDRDPIAVGDTIRLREYLPFSGEYTGRELTVAVTHVQPEGFGIPDGFAMLSIELLGGGGK